MKMLWVRIVLVLCLGLLASPAAAEPIRIVALGDSDTSGKGVGARSSYPGQLETMLKERGHDVRVANEGREGQTSREALAKLDRTVPSGTAVAILQFGTSDIKANISPQAIRDTLAAMIQQLTSRGVKVLLIGARPPAQQQIPAGYDMAAYNALFVSLARESGIAYHRFSEGLPPIPQDREMKYYQRDGHLTGVGYWVLATNLTPKVERLLTAKPQ